MQTQPSSPPKPVTEVWQPERTRLPRLTCARRAFRAFARGLMKVLAFLCLKSKVCGLENFPVHGPALLVVNHLGDPDAVIVLSALPVAPEALGKIELYSFPLLGKLMDWYGIIWLHRGRPDRRALQAALQGFEQGRMIMVAPEGRQSLIGGLEEGQAGAAFLALKAGVPIVPIALTGTQNASVFGSLRRFRRAPVTLTVGRPFRLAGRATRWEGTRQIMEALAGMLPPEYRGVYGQ